MNRIKYIRKCLHMTQLDFAKKTGISQVHLHTCETGKKRASPQYLIKIAREFPEYAGMFNFNMLLDYGLVTEKEVSDLLNTSMVVARIEIE